MSKFFEGLEAESEKKVNRAINRHFNDESDEEKVSGISNKEKRLEEITNLCEITVFKKPKDVDQFFKKLTKYNNWFAKEGLPTVLLDFLNAQEGKNIPAVLKQKRSKLIEKYQMTEVILEVETERKEEKSHMEQINSTLLIEDLDKRKEALLAIEGIRNLKKKEEHRINLYILGCLVENNLPIHYTEIIRRLNAEKDLVQDEEEEEILKTRIGRYTRTIIKYIQNLHNHQQSYQEELSQFRQVVTTLLPITNIPQKGNYEIAYFLENEPQATEYPIINALKQIRELPYEEAISVCDKLFKTEEIQEETTSENIFLSKAAEEAGHRAFAERDFDKAADLLEKAFYSPNIWSLPQTDTILSVLSLCFEKRMRNRRYFSVFKADMQAIGRNLLLLKSEVPKEEIARAFIYLRLGEYLTAESILQAIIPDFECRALLKARALEHLLTPTSTQ
ncbi:hypothetical protein NEHOM01_1721 [Nematocida homosporus]|uniref:uncharacterized protein n=1 Tax=Nematocida homosporus TaxID=1912981 RepID=UPI00221FF0EB|nr:uncharacterized protein NEHOM01_1721 [Nematocida homosporus]KAI5186820.1 hypothetical protein NEHOM01_1721 [Nematocida homosporus]